MLTWGIVARLVLSITRTITGEIWTSMVCVGQEILLNVHSIGA